MRAPEHPETAHDRARRIVNFWRRRSWLSSASPIHVHPLDVDKLVELIAAELDRDG